MKVTLIGLISILLTSCLATAPKYSGEGTFRNLLEARVECAKGLPSNAYGEVSCNALHACLATKGWYRVEKGGFDVPPQYRLACYQY